MYRRQLLASVAVIPITGCTLTFDQVLATVVSDVNLIASALPGVLKQLLALNLPWLTPDKAASANAAIAGVQAVATGLGSVSNQAAAQPLVLKIETYLTAFVTAIPIALLPPPFNTIVSAAIILLPVIYTMAAVAMPAPLPAPTVALTTDQARTALATPAS
jgi:hypothetical protein